MIYDVLFEFSDAQSVTADAVASYYIDWETADLNIEVGDPVFILVTVNTAPSGGTSAQVVIYNHTTSTINSGTALLTGEDIAIASLTAGTVMFCANLPPRADNERYFGVYYNVTGTTTALKVDAQLVMGMPAPLTSTQVSTSNI